MSKCLHGLAPQYLAELRVPVADVGLPGGRHLRSASRGLLTTLTTCQTMADVHFRMQALTTELSSLQRAELSFHHFI